MFLSKSNFQPYCMMIKAVSGYTSHILNKPETMPVGILYKRKSVKINVKFSLCSKTEPKSM